MNLLLRPGTAHQSRVETIAFSIRERRGRETPGFGLESAAVVSLTVNGSTIRAQPLPCG
jgi:hypothetical protein